MDYASFESRVRKANLVPMRRSDEHWQITGGLYVVNLYPETKTIYVNGTNRGHKKRSMSDSEFFYAAVSAATSAPMKRHSAQRDFRPNKKWVIRKKNHLWNSGVRDCFWCKKPFVGIRDATLEHIIPLARGGSAKATDNLTLACAECNVAHGCGNFIESRLAPDEGITP